jgi:hypothetical protein
VRCATQHVAAWALEGFPSAQALGILVDDVDPNPTIPGQCRYDHPQRFRCSTGTADNATQIFRVNTNFQHLTARPGHGRHIHLVGVINNLPDEVSERAV